MFQKLGLGSRTEKCRGPAGGMPSCLLKGQEGPPSNSCDRRCEATPTGSLQEQQRDQAAPSEQSRETCLAAAQACGCGCRCPLEQASGVVPRSWGQALSPQPDKGGTRFGQSTNLGEVKEGDTLWSRVLE